MSTGQPGGRQRTKPWMVAAATMVGGLFRQEKQGAWLEHRGQISRLRRQVMGKRPIHGAKECARRVRQMQAGTATPNYVHGDQYR
jgi:hypothetical protein